MDIDTAVTVVTRIFAHVLIVRAVHQVTTSTRRCKTADMFDPLIALFLIFAALFLTLCVFFTAVWIVGVLLRWWRQR